MFLKHTVHVRCPHRFLNYGSGVKRFPLTEVLKFALDFAESSPSKQQPTTPTTSVVAPFQPHDVEMESPVTSLR